ncbi:hypothetical protein ABZT03_37490 [Streptomyces sp. NPDC005574]|uniref:hypothetical protein n=1 Tax=Streptomyces sp. NPDC005574 TaxID=3156891 RepID=UPI0033BAB2ED
MVTGPERRPRPGRSRGAPVGVGCGGATGAVEGACRHLIADRLDLYWRYHAAREHERLYPAPDQRNYVPIA